MTISHEQVVDSLVAFYKNKGVDLTYLLEDPLFEKLPVETKIDAIKKHASTLQAGSPKGWNKEEKSDVYSGALTGTFGGLGTALLALPLGTKLLENAGISLAKGMAYNKAVAATLGGGAILGGALGALAGVAKAKNQVDARRDVIHQINSTIKEPTDTNAIGVLATRNLYNRQHKLRDAIVGRVSEKLDSITEKFNTDQGPKMFARTYSLYDPNVRSIPESFY